MHPRDKFPQLMSRHAADATPTHDEVTPLLDDVFLDADLGPVVCDHLHCTAVVALRGVNSSYLKVAGALIDPKRFHDVRDGTDFRTLRGKFMNMAKEGRLHELQLAHMLCPKHSGWLSSQAAAAKAGQIRALQWMLYGADPPLKNVTSWDRRYGDVCAGAAAGGQLGTLKWLRAQTPPVEWDGTVYQSAAENGHVHILEWAKAQSPPCPEARDQWVNMLRDSCLVETWRRLWIAIHQSDFGVNEENRRAEICRREPLTPQATADLKAQKRLAILRERAPVVRWIHANTTDEKLRTRIAEYLVD